MATCTHRGLAALLLLAACSGGAAEDVVFDDANNYSLTGSVAVPSVTTASGQAITVDWSTAAQDLQCHDLDPVADIDTVGLVRFENLDHEQMNEGLANNSIDAAANSGYLEVQPGDRTSISLDEMSFFGTDIIIEKEYVESPGTYMLLVTTGTEPGVGARIINFLTPSTESDVTSIETADVCGMLDDLQVDLHSLTPLELPAGDAWLADFSALTRDGLGNEFQTAGIDELNIGWFADLTVEDLEDQFLDVEYIADKLFVLNLLGGTKAQLELASNEGEKFSGVTDEGLWVLALRCSRCFNPAPVFFTTVVPAAEK